MVEWHWVWFECDLEQCWAKIMDIWHMHDFREELLKNSTSYSPRGSDGKEAVEGGKLPWQPLGSAWPIY